ncbi:MAG: hypothetical protein ACJAUH_002066 [Saprospiraceae bacterium]
MEKISLTQEYNEVVILINYALGVQ